jgi:hypothetical protein
VISPAREAALNTEERILSLAIGFIDTTTARALTAGVLGVNFDHGDTGPLRFVFDKISQLGKRPRMQCRSLAASGGCPVADTLQVFKGNSTTGVLRSFYDLLDDNVVGISGKATLFARQLLQSAFGRTGLLLLQLASKATLAKANALNLGALVELSVAISGDVGDSQVDTEKTIRVYRRVFVYVTALIKLELAFAIDKITFTMQTLKQLGGVVTDDKRHLLTTVRCPDRDDALV